jgi:hypothetical protein
VGIERGHVKTVFAPGSGRMLGCEHFIKKTSAKEPPHFPMLLKKTSGDGYAWTVVSREFFFRFQEHER